MDHAVSEQRRRFALDRARRVWALRVSEVARTLVEELGHPLNVEEGPRDAAAAVSSCASDRVHGFRVDEVLVAVEPSALRLFVPASSAECVRQAGRQRARAALRVVRPDGACATHESARRALCLVERLAPTLRTLMEQHGELFEGDTADADDPLWALHSALLEYAARVARGVREAAMENELIQFAVAFRAWRLEGLPGSLDSDDDDGSDGDDDRRDQGPQVVLDARSTQQLEKSTERGSCSRHRRVRSTNHGMHGDIHDVDGKLWMDDAHSFLRALIDPAEDLETTVDRLLQAIRSTMTPASSFSVAPGVTLYQSVRESDEFDRQRAWSARVRLGHCMVERVAATDRAAVVEALAQLTVTLREFRRLFGAVLDRLRDECGFPQPLSHHEPYKFAQNLVVKEGLTIANQRSARRIDGEIVHEWMASAQIDGLTLGMARESVQVDANARALHNAVVFLNDLVALQHPEHSECTTASARWTSRKRPLNEAIALSMTQMPPAMRPKRDLSEDARDALAEDALDRVRVKAYHQVVMALLTSRATVVAQLVSLEWHDDVDVRTLALAGLCTVEQRVSKKNGSFECEMRLCGGSVSFTHDDKQLTAAGRGVAESVREWFAQVHADWSLLAVTYASIKKKKRKMKGDQSLSAAVETRQSETTRGFVGEQTSARGGFTQFMIRVRDHVAVHRWAVKRKDAKRLRNTDFRNLLDRLLQPPHIHLQP